ncbi:MAG: hypothetical protein KC645_19415, partial [Gemmatimonadetes bacterium]|nr:hypothetical protein [Gemmatimonadota bacterium]
GANDLVVPAASVGAAAEESWTLRGGEAVSHLGYLSRPEARGRIATWLLRDGAPLQVTTAPTAGRAETGSPVPAAPAPDDAAPEPPRVERDDPPAAADAVERPVSTLQTRPPRPPGPRPLRPPRAPGRPRSP